MYLRFLVVIAPIYRARYMAVQLLLDLIGYQHDCSGRVWVGYQNVKVSFGPIISNGHELQTCTYMYLDVYVYVCRYMAYLGILQGI